MGNVIDSEEIIVKLPERRKQKIVQSCRELFSCDRAKIRQVAKVIGSLVAAFPAIEMGKLHCRRLESAKIAALKEVEGNFDKWMVITHEMKADLIWWLKNIEVQNRKIFREGTETDLYTDASNLGWGACLNHQIINGKWSLTETILHINAKELKAIFLALQSFIQQIRGKHIRVFL